MNTHFLPCILLAFVLSSNLVRAADPKEIPLWPNGAPGSQGRTTKEIVEAFGNGEHKVSGIQNPSITPYLPPKEKATGLSVIIAPGGAHRFLAIDHEGYNVAKWLSERGIAAFVLKYRLAKETNSIYKIETHALADTQRAIRLVRSHAREWNINRIGIMGFSAGGELAAMAGTRFDKGSAAASDPIERESSRPDFQALIYPGRSADIQPTSETVPAFLACASNDRPDISEGLAEVYLRFKKVKVPAELHIYADGGHGFGLRETNTRPVGNWAARFDDWLRELPKK
jgi:endo-1,4-beta-xylanase